MGFCQFLYCQALCTNVKPLCWRPYGDGSAELLFRSTIKQGMQDRKNVVLNSEVIDRMGSAADVEQAVEIVPDTRIAQKEFSQWDTGLFTGRKTSND